MADTPASGRKFYYHIDLMRFLFSVLIVLFHVLNSNIIPFVSDPIYETLGASVNYSTNIVACFFMISGFFMYQSVRTGPQMSIFEYIAGRAVRLWPAMFVALLSEYALSGKFDLTKILLNGAFLQCSGLSLSYQGILWYVSSFFFASIFLFAILQILNKRKAAFVISLLTYFSLVFLINYNYGYIGGRETVLYVVNLGIVRGVSGIGVGILLHMVYEKLCNMLDIAPPSAWFNRILFGVKLVFEIFAVIYLVRYFLLSARTSNHMELIIIFSVFLLCLVSDNDPLGRILNRKWIGFAGKYAYSIYVVQQAGFIILKKTLWTSESFTSNVWLALSVSVLFVVALGIAVFYIVEQPCTRLYQKWYRRYKQNRAAMTAE
jgi:peptidoglycan/LPS O-acetylase OafA/YrhL